MLKVIRSHRALIALNVVLLVVLVGLLFETGARAQNSTIPGNAGQNSVEARRVRGDYTMISGKTNAGGSEAIFILDSANQELIALKWETGKQALAGIGYRNLLADSKALPGR